VSPRVNVPFGDLSRESRALASALEPAFRRVLERGWFVLGPEVKSFEEAFASYCSVAHAVGVANGTEAIQLALAACGVGAGDEVITAANAGVPGPIAIRASGARPVFADVDEDTHALDAASVEAAVGPRTRAILLVHLFGRLAPVEPIAAVAERHGLALLEDCAQAHGAARGGVRAGAFGRCGCFSFYPTKNLGALGDGGAIVTTDDGLAARLRELRQYGWRARYVCAADGGINSRLDDLQAAMLLAKLPHLEAWNARRSAIATAYGQLLRDAGLVLPAPAPEGEHVHHLYVVRHPRRDALRERLRALGVATEVHYPVPAHLQSVPLGRAPACGLPVTERLAREVLSLPLHPWMSDAEVEAVASAVRRAAKEQRT
jgi:dTDP-3-amino-3,4,6-trideoxy-alpha-D-glucose transaminase